MKLLGKRILLLLCGILLLGIPVGLLSIVQQLGKPDQTQAELEAAFQSGKLVLIAFYSKNCKYCKADEPLLEDLTPRLYDILTIVRVDVGKPFGKQLAQQVGVRGVPSYFLVDPMTETLLYQQEGPLQKQQLAKAIQAWFQRDEGGAE